MAIPTIPPAKEIILVPDTQVSRNTTPSKVHNQGDDLNINKEVLAQDWGQQDDFLFHTQGATSIGYME